MNRRRFLQQSAVVPLAAAFGGVPGTPPIDADAPVVIIGAGLAGLRTAEILRTAGTPVVVLEAQPKAGGRVRTIRAPFNDGLLAEAGPIRIASTHRAVLQAVRAYRLPLVPFASTGESVTAIHGRPAVTPEEGAGAWMLDLKPAERMLTPGALLERYVGQLPSELGDPAAPASAFARWGTYDRQTWPGWLRSRGASPDAIRLMTAGGDSSTLSALYVLRQYAMLRPSAQRYKILGGMDRLPAAMAAALGNIVRYNVPVVRVERQAARFRVDYMAGTTVRSLVAGRVVFAIPLTTMRQIEMRPRLSAAKEQAIDRIAYYPGVRFMLQTKQRFWQAAGLNGSAKTDRALEVWDSAYDQFATRGLLGASVGGEAARQALGMTTEGSVSFGVNLVAEAFPGIRSEFEKGAVQRWSLDPWALGAFAVYGPGQMTALMPLLAAPEEGIHFAGEHTSAWTGWMEGALESGERAAREVLTGTRRA